ncbi:MAG: single-stranded DNA-binding protein [Bacillota bacterium]
MNKVIVIGRLTKDPEIRETSTGKIVASFTVAVDRRVAKGAEKKADFINCVAWEGRAEFIKNYFAKGVRIAVEGRLETRNWDDAEGKKRYVTEVIVEEVYFADGRQDGTGGGGTSAPRAYAPAGANSNPSSGATSAAKSSSDAAPASSGGDEGFYPVEDDDLPF